ncbi:MAG: wax ester/triacylglycerol synthase family O-acyltransferase [Pseudomonadales bacterium]
MARIVKNIPLMDLMSFLLESVESPKHVGALQIYEPVNGSSAEIVARVLQDYRASDVAPPFNYVPVFPTFGMPKWAECDDYDPHYHVRQAALPKPGTLSQLIDLVTDLHAGIMDRSHPGYIAYIIEGLEDHRFAIYWKMHHAYIDGASAVMRFDAAMSKTAEELPALPLWAPLLESSGEQNSAALSQRLGDAGKVLNVQARAMREVALELGKATLRAGGMAPKRRAPLPFSAPKSVFNQPVHATRRLGIGSLDLAPFKTFSRKHSVSINEVALTIVGAALERYAHEFGTPPERPLVAVCPMGIRQEGDTSASTQIAAISVKLGEPGAAISERLQQVHASSIDAKEDAKAMSREALMNYLVLIGGLADLLDRSPLAGYVPPLTNVNVSNVAGPSDPYYLSGAKLLQNYPVSTLAGGAAINITFISMAGRMDYAIISDAKAIPHAQKIADYMADAFNELSPKRSQTRRKKTATRKAGVRKAVAGKSVKSRPKTRVKVTEN